MESIIASVNDTAKDVLTENAFHYAATNGIVMLASDSASKSLKQVPFTLFPSPVPRVEFEFVIDLQPHLNRLMHLLSLDIDFLSSSLQSVTDADEFTRNMFNIYKNNYQSSLANEAITLGIFRSDYMFDSSAATCVPKQIEINTIASSFSGIGSHKMQALYSTALRDPPFRQLSARVPLNRAARVIARGFAGAWRRYGGRGVVVFFVSDVEHNVCDQRAIEFAIYAECSDVVVRRKRFSDVVDSLIVDKDRKLIIDGEEVAVAYFRTCYTPQHFPSQQHWRARMEIERSRAVKSPNMAHQLVGCKKLQEILTRPGVVERYIDDPQVATNIRRVFAGIYTLDMGADGDAAVVMAMKNPDDFVLKPQREGGGNNLYGEDLRRTLAEVGKDARRSAYILMDKIRPVSSTNFIVSDGTAEKAEVVSELGVFGVIITEGKTITENTTAGHLLRSKSKEHDDGGVAAGVAVLDAPCLY